MSSEKCQPFCLGLNVFWPYGVVDCGQHWFRLWLVFWWHQAINNLNQCWFLSLKQFWWNYIQNRKLFVHKNTCKMSSAKWWLQCVDNIDQTPGGCFIIKVQSYQNKDTHYKENHDHSIIIVIPTPGNRDHFVYVPSQWEMTLHCNVIFNWVGSYTKLSLGKMLFILKQEQYSIFSHLLSWRVVAQNRALEWWQ